MTSTYKFNVVMTCSGCSGAIDRVLKKTEGVSSYDISLEKQEVLVHASSISYDDVLAKIKKTGKEVKSGEVHRLESASSAHGAAFVRPRLEPHMCSRAMHR
ncbi:BZ3500_MvSof-1268-A1-R1_Chr2-1g04325 [Microbotryum saponariae]|uniref:BZ3500_MvSof-1268-A1-R1_Chr2-1g04325 protein n=1 Tax=Microbotryum saponariae TaxID=289078 RepID=A0A2X0K734_9BASI|nr:BZ3500_MvSof-1268-A1-R1_Chr2-1g04325 [Microbotryum saponariae]SCZ91438.1 BZ3501_MvSof-1269-A2-R1_Chr2-1g03981 [Microbotryum saponariae]